MKLLKCFAHEVHVYTLKSLCPQCNKPTQDAHYKFIKLQNAPKREKA